MNYVKRNTIILIFAAILGMRFEKTVTVYDVPSCYYYPGCDSHATPKGTLMSSTYGYPITYQTHLQFTDSSGNTMYSDGITLDGNLGFINSLYNISINIFFWFAAFYFLVKLFETVLQRNYKLLGKLHKK